jgi:hypothetical protein
MTGWANPGFYLHGPMGVNGFAGWLEPDNFNGSLNSGQVTQPSNTVLLAEKDTDDIRNWVAANPTYPSLDTQAANYSAYGPWGVFTDQNSFVGPSDIPDGSPTIPQYDNSTAFASGVGYNNTSAGAVSTKYSAQSVFVFTDGHAKSMIPSATNPNQATKPQNNMWDALR